MEEAIDFVILWVDGNDPAWREEKEKYSPGTPLADREERYRDWGFLPYLFRSIEKFAPWVRTIHFVTWGHLPKWLNVDHEKLHIVRHEDYMPKEYLPVFNSNALEICLHRIPGLSERFVYFNDDTFLLRSTRPTDFFRGDKVVDMLALQPVVANPKNPIMSHLFLNNSVVLSKYFDKRANMRKQPLAYFKPGYPIKYWGYNVLETCFPLFTGFYTVHSVAPFLKKTYEEVWEKEAKLLDEVSSHRFRGNDDVNQYLFREWQKLSGDFVPANVKKHTRYFEIGKDQAKLVKTITSRKCRILCINDVGACEQEDQIREELINAFNEILPKKSSFEL